MIVASRPDFHTRHSTKILGDHVDNRQCNHYDEMSGQAMTPRHQIARARAKDADNEREDEQARVRRTGRDTGARRGRGRYRDCPTDAANIVGPGRLPDGLWGRVASEWARGHWAGGWSTRTGARGGRVDIGHQLGRVVHGDE